MAINCDLIYSSSAEHLTQIYTGFGLLEKRGLINLCLQRGHYYRSNSSDYYVLRLLLNGKIKVTYDLFDGNHLSENELTWSDYYFKRSYDSAQIESQKLTHKVFPFGLNYSVYGPNDHWMKRFIWEIFSCTSRSDFRNGIRFYARNSVTLSYLLKTKNGRFPSIYEKIQELPRFDLPPKIIFLTRLWDPSRTKQQHLRDERNQINQTRLECVRLLKREFKNDFVGGIEPDDFAVKNFPEYIADPPSITRKSDYLNLVRNSSICITTQGLMGSNGWKLAEYVAMSKAIVSESLNFSVPGGFSPGRNYFEFKSPQECVSKVWELFINSTARYEMMKSNYIYYQTYLRPDILIWNTLTRVLQSEKMS